MTVTEPYQIPVPSPATMAHLAISMAREMGLPSVPASFLPASFLPKDWRTKDTAPIPGPPKTIDELVDRIPDGCRYPPLDAIMRAVSIATKVPLAELKSERRFVPAARARAIYYFVARELTPKSLPAIGRSCGGRDHSTILNGIKKVQANRKAFEPELSTVIDALRMPE